MDLRAGLLSRFKWVWILRSENPFSPETAEGVRITTTVINRASEKLTTFAMVNEHTEKV